MIELMLIDHYHILSMFFLMINQCCDLKVVDLEKMQVASNIQKELNF